MRSALARLALTVTSMVALAFLIPLALVVRQMAAERAIADAHQQAAGLVAVLAVSDDRQVLAGAIDTTPAGGAGRIAIYLPGQAPIGSPRAGAADVRLASAQRRSLTAPVRGGMVYLQATAMSATQTAVIEVFVPQAELHRGVAAAWLAIAVLAVALVGGSVLVADRLGFRLVRSARELAESTRAFGNDLSVRIAPTGPPELVEVGAAFNAMADRVVAMVDSERELAADLSHRLRTPLTALRLDADVIPPGPVARRVREAVDALEAEVDAIILARGSSGRPVESHCDLVDVLGDRMAFWAVLAEDHGRPWRVTGADAPFWIPVSRDNAIGVVDALLGNVFEHTPQGTAFAVHVRADRFVVEDAGPGIDDVAAALRRGHSTAGSTGLGLSIVVRVAEAVGGLVEVDRGELGGARVALLLPGWL